VGTRERICPVTKKLRRAFPRLFGGQYQITSKKTRRYNCIAWPAGQTSTWWEASADGFWPDGILDDGTVEAAVRLFEGLGYARGGDASWEPGVAKVAIYGDERGSYTHVARQLNDGRWTSKLGKGPDIEHDTLESLTGGGYGSVVQILRKSESLAAPPTTS
jgi:hypothetical protein